MTRPGAPRALVRGLLVLCAGVLPPVTTPLNAQQRCRFTTSRTGYSQSSGAGNSLVHYVSGGIDYRCPGGVRILADSAAIFQRNNLAELYGNVRFQDPETELVARRAFYYGNNRQLNAWENIRLIDRINGAVITGEELTLYRATSTRPLDRMIIRGGNPHATVFLSDGGMESIIPYEVDAERFTLEGRRFFRAGGGVEVFRATLHAVGDSLDFDQELGVMSVFEEARVTDANFDLTAHTVTVLTPQGLVEEVLARENAQLRGDGVFLEAPTIRMFIQDNSVQRLVAIQTVPPVPTGLPLPPVAEGTAVELGPRPQAITGDFQIWADSIDIRSPGQTLDRVIAVGAARGESLSPDSAGQRTLPQIASKDWMEGDTIVIAFGPPAAGGVDPDSTSGQASLKSVTSMGSAMSLYRLPPSDTSRMATEGSPALHYVRASVIRVHLDRGEVTRMEVEGRTSGFHFEPNGRTRPDTAQAPREALATQVPHSGDRLLLSRLRSRPAEFSRARKTQPPGSPAGVQSVPL